ncbi:hypothetical protein [Shewanella nanhaiensis]|nr:hypothetical protein [Shewanella nanhaiensis]
MMAFDLLRGISVQQRPCLTASSAPASCSLAHGFAIFAVVNGLVL